MRRSFCGPYFRLFDVATFLDSVDGIERSPARSQKAGARELVGAILECDTVWRMFALGGGKFQCRPNWSQQRSEFVALIECSCAGLAERLRHRAPLLGHGNELPALLEQALNFPKGIRHPLRA
jgi:hypothetical protein